MPGVEPGELRGELEAFQGRRHPQGDGQQPREYDDASRCGNGQQGDPMQQRLSSVQLSVPKTKSVG